MRLKREENHNELVSKKGLEPLRLKARAPKTLVAAISPLRDKLAYALSMMRLTKQVKFGCSQFSRNLSTRPFNRHSVATRLRHQTHNSPFLHIHFWGAIGGETPINTSRL